MVRDKNTLETPKYIKRYKYRCRRGSPEPSVSNQTSPTSFSLIPLTQGKFAIVDKEDYEKLSKYNWFARKTGNNFYAVRSLYLGGGRKNERNKTIYMHHMIIKCSDGFEIDHINHNGLDNRKQNLRICRRWQNNGNQRKTRGTSQYKGVFWDKTRGKWVARIKHTFLGRYDNEKEAAETYNKAAIEYWGNFAELNSVQNIGATN